MLLLDKIYYGDNKKIKITIFGQDNLNIDEIDLEKRINYLDQVINNPDNLLYMTKLTTLLKSAFGVYKPDFTVAIDTNSVYEVMSFSLDKIVTYSKIMKNSDKEIFKFTVDNYNIGLQLGRNYYESFPKQQLDEALKDFNYVNNTLINDLTLEDKKVIAAYELFYNEEPNFYSADINVYILGMFIALDSNGISIANQESFFAHIADLRQCHLKFNLADEVFDEETKEKIKALSAQNKPVFSTQK